jgi:hypothetical protein
MKTGFLTRNIPAAFDRRWLPKALLASPFVFAAAFGAPQALRPNRQWHGNGVNR